jgi:hypothetical protein
VKGDWGLGDGGAGQLAPTEVAQNGVMLLIGLGARQTSFSPFTFHGIARGSIAFGSPTHFPAGTGVGFVPPFYGSVKLWFNVSQ